MVKWFFVFVRMSFISVLSMIFLWLVLFEKSSRIILGPIALTLIFGDNSTAANFVKLGSNF